MNKLSIIDLINFRNNSDYYKKKVANSLRLEKKKETEKRGHNYWASCLSALSNSFKFNDSNFIVDKKHELKGKLETAENDKSKIMYKSNLDILSGFEDYDLKELRPLDVVDFLQKYHDNSILNVSEFKIQALPHHVFTFKSGETEEVGSIWFVAKKKGFHKNELGMFTDILYRYLTTHFATDHILNSKYCMTIDVSNKSIVSYDQLERGEISFILNSTLEDVRNFM